jgi:hypothetical protein
LQKNRNFVPNEDRKFKICLFLFLSHIFKCSTEKDNHFVRHEKLLYFIISLFSCREKLSANYFEAGVVAGAAGGVAGAAAPFLVPIPNCLMIGAKVSLC